MLHNSFNKPCISRSTVYRDLRRSVHVTIKQPQEWTELGRTSWKLVITTSRVAHERTIGLFRVVGFSPNCCRGPYFFCSSGRFVLNRRLQFEPFSNPRSDLAYLTAAAVRTETDHPKTAIINKSLDISRVTNLANVRVAWKDLCRRVIGMVVRHLHSWYLSITFSSLQTRYIYKGPCVREWNITFLDRQCRIAKAFVSPIEPKWCLPVTVLEGWLCVCEELKKACCIITNKYLERNAIRPPVPLLRHSSIKPYVARNR
jgi:hypothetical protein